jgi:hypothetical protein
MGRNDYTACVYFPCITVFFIQSLEIPASHKGSWRRSTEMALLWYAPALVKYTIQKPHCTYGVEFGVKGLVAFDGYILHAAFMSKMQLMKTFLDWVRS